MKKRAIFLIVLIIIFGVGISFFMYFPKSIENALNRIKYPFEVGEILASQQIDENLTAVIYTNKEEKIHKLDIFMKLEKINLLSDQSFMLLKLMILII